MTSACSSTVDRPLLVRAYGPTRTNGWVHGAVGGAAVGMSGGVVGRRLRRGGGQGKVRIVTEMGGHGLAAGTTTHQNASPVKIAPPEPPKPLVPSIPARTTIPAPFLGIGLHPIANVATVSWALLTQWADRPSSAMAIGSPPTSGRASAIIAIADGHSAVVHLPAR